MQEVLQQIVIPLESTRLMLEETIGSSSKCHGKLQQWYHLRNSEIRGIHHGLYLPGFV